MKRFMVNVFATTGISLLLLSLIALLFQAKYICIQTVFQVFEANITVQLGLAFVSKLEIKYAVIEMLLDLILILIMLVMFGVIFHWFTSTPLWTLVILDLAIYMISFALNLFCMKKEAQEINGLIKTRNKKNGE
ncbi:MAG: hypothetical protein K2O16_18235 [Lachnospiraceae bacterium]|nr:hypothetical protein [Lachnospiraceae bacterium]